MKKFIKVLLIILGILLLMALILPVLFKDRIITELRNTVNKDINGHINFSDASLSLFKNFPKLTLSIDDLSCQSYVANDTSMLFQASQIQLGLNLWSLIRDRENIVVNKIILEKPIIEIIEYDSLTVNYDISKKADNDTSKLTGDFNLDIESYKINEGIIKYASNVSGMDLTLQNLEHEGSLQYTKDLIKAKTHTVVQELTYLGNGISLIKSAKLLSDFDFDFIKAQNLIKISKGEFNLNNLKLNTEGSLSTIGDSVIMDLVFKTPDNDFKDLFSIIPHAYTKDFDNVKSEGNFQLEAKLNGVYFAAQKIYPSWNMICNVKNGKLQYPQKSVVLENFNLDLVTENTGPSLNSAYVDLKDFSFLLNKQSLIGALRITDLENDAAVSGKLKGILNLSDLANFLPLDENTKLKGIIKPDVTFQFSESAIKNNQYEQIGFSGSLLVNDLNYHTKDQPDISVATAEVKMSPKLFEIPNLKMNLGKSDLSITGKLIDPLNFIAPGKKVTGSLKGESKLMDINEWQNVDSKKPKKNAGSANALIPDYINNLNLEIATTIDKLLYEDYDIGNIKASGNIQGNVLKINNSTFVINQNQVTVSGGLDGIYTFMMYDKLLSGTLSLKAKQFDADRFMAKAPATNSTNQGTSNAQGPFIVPENFDISIGFTADEIIYKPLKMNTAVGKMRIVNHEIQFEDLRAGLSGGKIKLKGLYNTASADKPSFNFKFDLLQLPFSGALASFVSLKKIAPIMEYIKGQFNTSLIMDGVVGKDMLPVLESINADGFFETIQGSIQGFKPLEVLSDKLKIKELKNLNIGNTKNWLTISNGIVSIKEFTKKIEGMDVDINGSHKISGDMDYNFVIKIPKNKVSQFASAIKLDKVTDQLDNILNKAGIGGSVLTNLNLLVNMKGSLTQPSFSFKLLNNKGEDTDMAESVAESIKNKVMDTVKTRIESEIQKMKDKAGAEINKLEDSLKNAAIKKAEELKNEAIEKATKQVMDSISQKILKKDSTKQVDQIKDKIKDWNPFKKDKK